jgi:hypothetical protein
VTLDVFDVDCKSVSRRRNQFTVLLAVIPASIESLSAEERPLDLSAASLFVSVGLVGRNDF